MTIPSFAARALRICAFVALASLAAACSGSSDDDDPSETDNGPVRETAAEIDEFFEVGEPTTASLAAGDDLDLPGGGSMAIPLEGPAGVDVTVAAALLTAEAQESFAQWNEAELQDTVSQVTIVADGEAPTHVIVRLPSPDDSGRVFAAGYIDDDTENVAWTPVPTTYDSAAGEVTAAIGLGEFQSDNPEEPQVNNLAPLSRQEAGLTYHGYVGVAVSTQQFNSEILFEPIEPAEAISVEFQSDPIPVEARVGSRLSNITHQPLGELVVESPFGRRRAIPGAPRASRLHNGADYDADTGTTVYAAGDGRVTTVQWQDEGRHGAGAGYYVKIDHGNGEVTKYFHLTDANAPAGCATSAVTCCTDLGVCEGQNVNGGQPIASSDNTGHTSGPHLHFEVHQNSVAVDPKLIYDEKVTATIAMAIDYQVQDSTKDKITLTRGIIEPEDIQSYISEVSVSELQPGEYKLQFVAVEPRGTLEVLAEIPLTITGPFSGVTGSYTLWRDIERTAPDGDVDQYRDTTVATFDLVAVGENRLEGPGHVSYVQNQSFIREDEDCSLTTSIATVEWDVFYEGEFTTNSDGTIDVQFTGDPPYSPDYVFTQTSVGGCNDHTQTLSGMGTPIIVVRLVDGEYYYREDRELGEGETGEDYFETVVDATNN